MSSWCRSTDYLLTQCLYFFTCKSVDWNDSRQRRIPSNMSKCYCWSELGCQDSKKSDLVLEDLDVQGFRSSVHTNSQYLDVSLCLPAWSHLLNDGYSNQCVCSQHDFERNWILPKLPSPRFLFQIENWPRKETLTYQGREHLLRKNSLTSSLFSCLLSLSAAPRLTVVSRIRYNKGCMNRIDRKAVFTKFVLLKPWSQQNPLLFLKIQASNEIIWCEMHRTDQQTPRRLSLLNALHN